MVVKEARPERLSAFSDGVFAVIMTILVLDLRPPEIPTLQALLTLWPTGVSYAVSYLFIAVVWVNHHHLFRFAEVATKRLIWGNFAHLFSVSLLPFSTAWIADTRMAPIPVALYAAVFVLVNATYLVLCGEAVDRPGRTDVPTAVRRMMRMRSMLTLAVFTAASILSLQYPLAGIALICLCLVLYLRPEAPGQTA